MGFYDWDRIEPEEISDLYLRKVAVGDTLTVAKLEVKEGSITLPHHHDNEEVIIVLEGLWRFRLPSGEVTLGENQMLSIPPGVEHSSEALADTVALDVCSAMRPDWSNGDDQPLHCDPDQSLWAV
ncbi:MAG TPA: cupin domain-containing protein [Pyrinomonadaceae bacterium]|nr:cupin domain-containing protein [Pyrinomonadaceae bacterium]